MGKISILKEEKTDEKRVVLEPKHIEKLAKYYSYKVYVEENAGIQLGFQNSEYEKYGAEIVSKEKAWTEGDLLLKYKAPLPSEYQLIRPNKVIAGLLHAEGDPDLINELLKKKM